MRTYRYLILSLLALFSACAQPPESTPTPTFTPAPEFSGTPQEPGPAPTLSTASTWETRADLPEPNSEIAVTELDGRIYVIGGYPASRVTVSTMQIYDVAADNWSLAPPLPIPLNHAMAAAAGGLVYVIGGQTSTSGGGPFLNTVFAFNPDTESWSERAPMPTARSSGAAAVIDGRIFVVGGRPPRGADFAMYDPAADTWEVLPNLPTARNHLTAAAVAGRLYVIGGRFGSGFQSEMTDVVEVYDSVSGAWSNAAPMPTVRGGLNAAVTAGCIHVFGGEGPGGVFPQHEAYDPITDSWFSLAALPVPVHGVTGSAVINGWIHLPGGGTEVGGSSGSTIHQVVRVDMVCGE